MPSALEQFKDFSKRHVFTTATNPLKDGIEIAIFIDEAESITLTKRNKLIEVLEISPKAPEISFWISSKAVEQIHKHPSEDVGDIGIELIKLMAKSEVDLYLRCKIHAGLITLTMKGYLGVIPLGGSKLMKFLATKGFSGMGRIKQAIDNLRG